MRWKLVRVEEEPDKVKIKYFRWTEFLVIFLIFGCLTTLQIVLFLGVDELQGRGFAYIVPSNIFTVIVAASVCLFTGYMRYRTFDKPFQVLSAAAKKVAAGDFSVYLKPVHKANKRDYTTSCSRISTRWSQNSVPSRRSRPTSPPT